MDPQFVNNKPSRNSSGKTMSSSSLSSASLSSSSSTSSPNIRQSQSFAYNNNGKFSNNYNNSRFTNNNNNNNNNNNPASESNRRINNSNQPNNNFGPGNSNSNAHTGRKAGFNSSKGAKSRQFYDNTNFYYSNNSNYSNETNSYEHTNKKKPTGQNPPSKLNSNFDSEENAAPKKQYKERKNTQLPPQFKEVKKAASSPSFNATQITENVGVSMAPAFHLNYSKFQPPPFQPPAYHQNNKHLGNTQSNNRQNQLLQQSQQKNKLLIEKYDRKYNLISFILLRKKDEYLIDNKYYLNDQSLYQKIDNYVEKRQLKSLKSLFLSEKSPTKQHLANFTNSYNCNMFVYTIRRCLEALTDETCHFVNELIRFLFRKNVRPFSFYLIDGDYPKRNLMHYAARYNCELIPCLLLQSFKESAVQTENLEKTVIAKEEEGEVL